MSDGMGFAARSARAAAIKFARDKYPGAKVYGYPDNIPMRGKAILVYEDRLDCAIEIVKDRRVIATFLVTPSGEVTPSSIGPKQPKQPKPVQGSGYYKTNHYCG